jgi:ABC-type amino acid transport system permease subunit
LIVVILTWLGAIALGYLQQPQFVHGLGNLLFLLAILLIAVSAPLQISHALRLRRTQDDQWKVWAWSVALDVLALPVLVLFLIDTWPYEGQ